ncbi:MAG: hypothetical protein KA310_16975 [Pseudomonadales bacterium]|nr:hypothetical protein [Pseudomonadales bacterium]
MYTATRIALAIVLLLAAAPMASACSFDTDCEPGSRCVKERGKIEGYCAGGLFPGNDNDREPYRDPLDISESVGDTCSFDTDCGVGARCSKAPGRIDGVCVKRR